MSYDLKYVNVCFLFPELSVNVNIIIAWLWRCGYVHYNCVSNFDMCSVLDKLIEVMWVVNACIFWNPLWKEGND